MLPAVPEQSRPPARTPPPELTRLALSTTATAAVVGVGVGIGEQSVVLGVVFAVVAGGVRLAVAAWRRIRSLPVESIDPWALSEPWRGLVQQALDAETHFRAAAEAWPAGPLRERLVSLEPAVEAEVRGVWVAARQGAAISGGYPTSSKQASAAELSAELEAVQQERSELPAGQLARRDELDRAEQALAAQLQAALRAKGTADAVQDRLRTLVARLDETVTSLVAMMAGPGGAGDVEAAAGTIEGLGQQIAALQAGIDETMPQLPEGGSLSPPPRS